jgi:acetylornithine aminotransferase
LEVIKAEKLQENAKVIFDYFKKKAQSLPHLKAVKGRGLMLGLEFDFPISKLRKKLIYKHHIFTGNAKNPNVLRILPSLTIQKKHIDVFFTALKTEVL